MKVVPAPLYTLRPADDNTGSQIVRCSGRRLLLFACVASRVETNANSMPSARPWSSEAFCFRPENPRSLPAKITVTFPNVS